MNTVVLDAKANLVLQFCEGHPSWVSRSLLGDDLTGTAALRNAFLQLHRLCESYAGDGVKFQLLSVHELVPQERAAPRDRSIEIVLEVCAHGANGRWAISRLSDAITDVPGLDSTSPSASDVTRRVPVAGQPHVMDRTREIIGLINAQPVRSLVPSSLFQDGVQRALREVGEHGLSFRMQGCDGGS